MFHFAAVKEDTQEAIKAFIRTDLKKHLLGRSVNTTRVEVDTADGPSRGYFIEVHEDGKKHLFRVRVNEVRQTPAGEYPL